MSIPIEVEDLLKDQAFGVSFPCRSGCQMRFIRNGVDLGGYYSYAQWGGIRKAVEAAISENQKLRTLYKRKGAGGKVAFRDGGNPKNNTGVMGVSGSWYFDPRRDKYYFRYLVRWVDPEGQAHIKTFNLVEPFTADQQFHTFRTAVQFRKSWEFHMDDLNHAMFEYWRSRRL